MKLPLFRHVLALFRTRKLLVARFTGTSLARSAFVMAEVLLISQFLSGVLGEGQGLAAVLTEQVGARNALLTLAGLLVTAYVGASLMLYDNHVAQQRIVRTIELGLMNGLVRHLLTLSVPFFDRQSPGDFIQAVRTDVGHLRVTFLAYAGIFMESVVALGLIVAALRISPEMAFWVLFVLPLSTIPLVLIAWRIRTHSHNERARGYVVFDVILQILRGIRIIKIYGGEEQEAATTIEKARLFFDEQVRIVRVRELSNVVLESLAGFSVAAVVIVGGFRVMAGSLGWPELLAFLIAIRTLHGPLFHVNANIMQIQRFWAASDRVARLMAETPDVTDRPGALPLRSPPLRISVDNAAFQYGEQSVIKGLSFDAQAGETIGIAGPSGSGKTTLLGLIARLFDPTSGSVRFDGQDIRDYFVRDVYAQVAMVTQEPFLFDASVRENIRCGRPDASDAEVEEAARQAEIHAEILQFEDGYDTELGVGGRGVSGGQAQRINVARAFLKNAPILLLDEATSSLDSIAEARVQRALDHLMAGKTTFSVAHRLSSLRNADRILVLDRGQCVGLASHDELLRDCPLYEKLWETQQLGALPTHPPQPSQAVGALAWDEPDPEQP